MKQPKIYVLAIAPFQRILHGLEYTDKSEATRRAKEENRRGEYKGRGVKVVLLSKLEFIR